MRYRKQIGDHGEEFASKILSDMGYEIMERNYWTKLGEIDIIARRDRTLHFIEVKTRTQNAYGYPAESVTQAKLDNMRKAAQIYMSNRRLFWRNVSFDVFEVMTNMISNCI